MSKPRHIMYSFKNVTTFFYGAPDIDFESLAKEFRASRYAQAEQEEEDYCFIDNWDFCNWLKSKRILHSPDVHYVGVDLEASGQPPYTPAFWPTCPDCGTGKGETAMGRVLHDLNRCEWYKKCCSCGHVWDHKDEPYIWDKPMLDDDGRYTPCGCVPYSISLTCNVPFADSLKVCTELGWRSDNGLSTLKGLEATRRLGATTVPVWPSSISMIAGKMTLRRFLDWADPAKNYIVETKGHWLAVVKGENRDNGVSHGRAEVLDCWEVTPILNT